MKTVYVCGTGFLASSLYNYVKTSPSSFKLHGAKREFMYAHQHNNYLPLAQEIEQNQIDFVLNVSGLSNIQDSFLSRDKYLIEPLKQAQAHMKILNMTERAPTYIYLSSASVYGNTEVPADESQQLRPESPYALGKINVESYLLESNFNFKIKPSIILRVTSVYNNDLQGRILSLIRDTLRQGSPLTLGGSGYETRDFLHSSDLWNITHKITEIQKEISEIYNVGYGESISIRELVAIASSFNKNNIDLSKLVTFSRIPRLGDPENMKVEISKTKKLGILPLVPPKEGLGRYFEDSNFSY